MSDRELVMELVGGLPEDVRMEEIAREVELLARPIKAERPVTAHRYAL